MAQTRTTPNKRRTENGTSRQRLFAAAAVEFAARGFAGASVDRIAAAARVNKAMIYYHFKSKAALYREILRDMFSAVAAPRRRRSRPSTADPRTTRSAVSWRPLPREAEATPALPAHLVPRDCGRRQPSRRRHRQPTSPAIVKTLAGIVQEGVAAGHFTPVTRCSSTAGSSDRCCLLRQRRTSAARWSAPESRGRPASTATK